MEKSKLPLHWIGFALFALAFSARLIEHPWNLSPLTAVALFAAVALPRRWALLVPLSAMALTDPLLGWHATMPFTWAGVLCIGGIGLFLRPRYTFARSLLCAVGGATVFFVVSNLGVWLTGTLYPMTAEGLLNCFTAAIPFFRTSLIGDVAFTAALFGLFELSALLLKQPIEVKG